MGLFCFPFNVRIEKLGRVLQEPLTVQEKLMEDGLILDEIDVPQVLAFGMQLPFGVCPVWLRTFLHHIPVSQDSEPHQLREEPKD